MTRRPDYLAANAGRRVPMPGFVLLVHPRTPRDDAAGDDRAMRIGITVTKKVGNAVVRNRIKRRFRALAREILPEHGWPGADHVLIGRHAALTADWSTLREQLAKALAKSRIVAPGGNRSRPKR